MRRRKKYRAKEVNKKSLGDKQISRTRYPTRPSKGAKRDNGKNIKNLRPKLRKNA